MDEATAVDSGTTEPLPVYDQDEVPQSAFDALLTRIVAPISTRHPDARALLESFIESQKAPAYNGPLEPVDAPKPIEHYPDGVDSLTCVKQRIVQELFNAITREDTETIVILIQHNLVSANATNESGRTPLLEAIFTNVIHLVKELLDLGADPNAFGIVRHDFQDQVSRTPLMFAASIGSLPIVKLLFQPPYSANDALVAPDGQIALRLASTAGHRAIVEYLPSRRAGGFLRWRTQNAPAIARMKKALGKIGTFIKFFIWDVPRFVVWSIPKHVVVLPVVRGCKWCWERRKVFASWCKHQVTEMPKRVVRFGKWVWKGAKKTGKELWKFGRETLPRGIKKVAIWLWVLFTERIPKAVKATGKWVWMFVTEILPKWIKATAMSLWELVKKTGKGLWKFGTETLPIWITKVAIWLWKLLTERILMAVVITLKWIWAGISSFGKAIWDVILKTASLLHTILGAVVTFLRHVTLKDIWNGFCDLLRAIFITFPAILWSWIRRFGVVSYQIMEALFGWFGELLWWIANGLQWLVLYIPRKLWIILQSIGGSIARAWSELMVWINPKA